jgi:hypothetical protein
MNPKKYKTAFRVGALSMICAAALSACGGGGNSDAFVDVNLSGLEDLGPTAVYEGWLIVNGSAVTTGRFSVNAAGAPSQSRFPIARDKADAATAFVLTIEPAVNDLPTPSDTHYLAGDFNAEKTTAQLSIGHPKALGTDFSAARASFILATPTSADTTDGDQGIWFLKVVNGVAQPGIVAPTLPKGWVYEGWAVANGKATSTGRFTRFDAADSDGAGATAGPLGSPAFPGQDFINPATKLPGGKFVISVEPEMDNSPSPFTLKPLVGSIGSDLAPVAQSLANTVGTGSALPHGTVTVSR